MKLAQHRLARVLLVLWRDDVNDVHREPFVLAEASKVHRGLVKVGNASSEVVREDDITRVLDQRE